MAGEPTETDDACAREEPILTRRAWGQMAKPEALYEEQAAAREPKVERRVVVCELTSRRQYNW